MKKIYLIFVFALAGALVPFTTAQDTNSQNSSTAASAQSGSANDTSAVSSRSGAEDASLTQQLQNKFSQDPALVNVQASVTNGTALITGTVSSKADEQRADDLARSVTGVKHVKDQLTVNPSAGASASKNNDQQDVSTGKVGSAPRTQSMSMPGATNPTNGETSATSTNPNSQASSVTGSATTSSTTGAQTAANTAGATQTPSTSQPSKNANNPSAPTTAAGGQSTAPNASTQASGSTATGENASSLPQSNASGEANMAGQTSTGAPSATSTPNTMGGVAGAATAPPASAAQSTTSTQSSSIGANAGAPAAPRMATTGVGIHDTATLQSQRQNALQNEPTLHNDSLSVNVTDNTIELGGAVQTGKEKQTAHRIASSFAGNRRVKDRITVSGRGTASSSPSGTLGGNPASNSSNPQTNQSNPSNNAQNPSANNPAANGDASANPR